MHFTLLISALAASALASPLATTPMTKAGMSDTWTPAPSTTASCANTDEPNFYVSFARSDPVETVIHNACVAMMPECAFRDRLPNGNFCTATVDYQIDGPKTYIPPNVDASSYTDEQSQSSQVILRPPLGEGDGSTDPLVFWKVQDCYGYFHQLLEEMSPEGCRDSEGSLLGELVVGEESSLAGTKFVVSMDTIDG
ncbi:hypothetical protein BM1_09434 [Bipolaris maydis]|nr:hypothetical protein BM1_09434 [Bipolaris maydis]